MAWVSTTPSTKRTTNPSSQARRPRDPRARRPARRRPCHRSAIPYRVVSPRWEAVTGSRIWSRCHQRMPRRQPRRRLRTRHRRQARRRLLISPRPALHRLRARRRLRCRRVRCCPRTRHRRQARHRPRTRHHRQARHHLPGLQERQTEEQSRLQAPCRRRERVPCRLHQEACRRPLRWPRRPGSDHHHPRRPPAHHLRLRLRARQHRATRHRRRTHKDARRCLHRRAPQGLAYHPAKPRRTRPSATGSSRYISGCLCRCRECAVRDAGRMRHRRRQIDTRDLDGRVPAGSLRLPVSDMRLLHPRQLAGHLLRG